MNSHVTVHLTADEFLDQYLHAKGVELVKGVLRYIPPRGLQHGVVCAKLAGSTFVRKKEHDVGYFIAANAYVRTELEPPTFRGPDLQFFRYERMPKGTVPIGIPDFPPDIVFEVRDYYETWNDMTNYAIEYLNADVKVVVLIDPIDRDISMFRTNGKPSKFKTDDTLSIPDLLPGYNLQVADLFED